MNPRALASKLGMPLWVLLLIASVAVAVLLIMIATAALFLFGGGSKGGGPMTVAPVATLTHFELFKAYNANEAKADGAYTGKAVEVTGDVHHTSRPRKNDDGDYYINFVNGAEWDHAEPSPPITVQVVFRPSEADKVGALKPGAKIKVVGKCVGYSSQRHRGFVILNNSYFR